MTIAATEPTGILRYRLDSPSPVIALAIHSGHALRDELVALSAPSEAERFYEEDPFTERLLAPWPIAAWTDVSRFEVDLNRPEETAVYLDAGMCWGIVPWRAPLPEEILARSRARHREAMALLDAWVDEAVARFGVAVVLDFHSYNYQRTTPVPAWWEDLGKPVINLGTRDTHPRFRPLLDELLAAFQTLRWQGRPITVGENVVFKGGYVHGRLQARHPDAVLCPSIELKKVFMDERTGRLDDAGFAGFAAEVNAAIAGALERHLPSGA
jgi:N-formylglutamate amidohydrolase